MTIKEFYDSIETMVGDSRVGPLEAVAKLFSPISIKTLQNFQDAWDMEKPFEEFVKAQNKKIQTCIFLEISVAGEIVREASNLPKLSWDTILCIP